MIARTCNGEAEQLAGRIADQSQMCTTLNCGKGLGMSVPPAEVFGELLLDTRRREEWKNVLMKFSGAHG